MINELAKYSKTYYYDCGHKVEAFFKLNHGFDFSKTGLMRPNDKCKRGWGHKWNKYGSESKSTYGLTTTPNGDGCGTCKDNCGAGGRNGMWDSWRSNGNSHGCSSCSYAFLVRSSSSFSSRALTLAAAASSCSSFFLRCSSCSFALLARSSSSFSSCARDLAALIIV